MRGTTLSFKKSLNATINLALLVIGCGLAWIVFAPRTLASGDQQSQPAAHLEGQLIPAPRGHSWAAQPATLVLVLRGGCEFCRASQPFYKRLSDLEKNSSLQAHLLALTPDKQATDMPSMHAAGLDTVFDYPIDSLKVAGTPTLLLIDTHGRVVQSWAGQLNSQQEQQVIDAVNSFASQPAKHPKA